MAKAGFWDFDGYWQTIMSSSYWFDSEWKQRRDINELQVEEAQVETDLSRVRVALAQTQRQVMELSLTIVVMARLLQEAGQLDLDAVHAKVDAELEKLRPKPAPIVAHPGKSRPPDVQVTCARCGALVMSSGTTITEKGTVCDSCAGV